MMHITSSKANIARMSQSISRSTLLRLLGGSVEFIITCTHTRPMEPLTIIRNITCQSYFARTSLDDCCRATGSEGLERGMLDQHFYSAKSTARS